MKIKIGFEIAFEAPQPTPMVILLNVHPSRQSDVLTSDQITTSPLVPIRPYHDSFGNECGRLFLPPGRTLLRYSGIVRDTGLPDPVTPSAQQIAVQDLPDQCILYLLPSRYCETDRLMHLAWSLFKDTPLGWPRVQAICDYV
ncbi:MAG: transglutaminase family protein, partial [Pseudolabrys sp.]